MGARVGASERVRTSELTSVSYHLLRLSCPLLSFLPAGNPGSAILGTKALTVSMPISTSNPRADLAARVPRPPPVTPGLASRQHQARERSTRFSLTVGRIRGIYEVVAAC
jgi:hypothetical protein